MGATVAKVLAAAAFGFAALGATAAYADGRDRYESHRPDRCRDDHDHRAHDANYYDFYAHDRYYRAGPYRGSGVSFSITLGDDRYDRRNRNRYDRDRHDRYDRYDRYDRRDNDRVIRRETFDTRYRARIVLVEKVEYSRRDRDLVCTVSVQGPEARYVPERYVRRIADRNCSRRAEVRVYA